MNTTMSEGAFRSPRSKSTLRALAAAGILTMAGAALADAVPYTGSGWVDVPNAAWFSQYSSILFGEGTLNYQGEDASFAGSFSVNPAGAKKVATVAVPKAATLALGAGGKIVQQGGLVKKGKGTLLFTGAALDFSNSTSPSSAARPTALSWNADGVVTGGVVGRGLNVHSGTVTITNTAVNFGQELFVGGLGANEDATLRLENANVTYLQSLYVNYAATNATLSAAPTARLIAKDSVFKRIDSIFVNRTEDGKTYPTGTHLRSEILLDNSVITNGTVLNMDPTTNAVTSSTTLTLDNGSQFVNIGDTTSYAISGGANLTTTTNTISILNGSKLLTTAFGLDTYYGQGTGKKALNTVRVGSGSTLGFLRSATRDNAIRWSVLELDDGTLMPWAKYLDPVITTTGSGTKGNAYLFYRWEYANVLKGGATLSAPAHSYAYLFPALTAGATAGGSVTVTGGGAFAISPTAVPIAVKDNSTLAFTPRHFLNEDAGLSMNGDHTEYDPYIENANITVESGSSIRVFGRNQTLMGMTLPACAVSFSGARAADSISAKLSTGGRAWVKRGSSCLAYLGDGSHALMTGGAYGNDNEHVLTYTNAIDLTRSFRISFEYSNGAMADRVVRGFVAFVHNDPRGTAAYGNGNQGLSYTTNSVANSTQLKIDKSVGMMVRTWGGNLGIYYCQNGFADASTYYRPSPDINYNLQPDRLRPLVATLAYDAAKKTFSYAISSPYGKINRGANRGESERLYSNTVSADLPAICGGTKGFFGLSSGADGGSPTQHTIANVSIRYLDELNRPCADVAGKMALGGGKATLSTYGNDETAGYAMRELAYADGATIDVTSTNITYGANDPSFVAFDQWKGAGTVTKTGAGNLGVRIQNTGANLTLAEGGLVLRRDYEDPYVYSYLNRMEREWIATWYNGWKDTDVYTSDAENGVWCGTGATGRSGVTALKRRIKVSGKWTMSFDYEASQNDGAYGAYITFHNDPRGYMAVTDRGKNGAEYNWSYALKGATQDKNIKSCAAIHFYNYADSDKEAEANGNHKIMWWQSDAAGTFSAAPEQLSTTTADSTGNEQIYIANRHIKGDGQPKVARKFHCVIGYDETAENPLTITLTQTQGVDGTEGAERKWTKSFAKKIPEIVGGDLCNLGLFYATGGQVTRVKIKNLTFRHDDATESTAKPYFAKVDVTAPNATVYLDGAKEYTYKLADAVNVSGGLTVKTLRKGGTLDLGGAKIGADATLAADGATVRLDKDSSASDRTKIVLTDGAKLNLDFTGSLQVRQITVDGKRYRQTSFDASNCDFITGTGTLLAGKGFCVLVK